MILGVLLGLLEGVAALCVAKGVLLRRVDETGVPASCSKLNDLRLKE